MFKVRSVTLTKLEKSLAVIAVCKDSYNSLAFSYTPCDEPQDGSIFGKLRVTIREGEEPVNLQEFLIVSDDESLPFQSFVDVIVNSLNTVAMHDFMGDPEELIPNYGAPTEYAMGLVERFRSSTRIPF